MTKAFGYVRVSTDEQFQNATSIAAQASQIMYYCDRPGAELDLGKAIEVEVDGHRVQSRERIYLESASAYKTAFCARPGGERIYREASDGDIVIISKLDRAFRSSLDAHVSLSRFRERGISMAFLDIGVDTSSMMGEFLFTIMSAVAQMESRRRSERVSEAARARKQQGRMSRNNTPPLMKWVGTNKGSRAEFSMEEYLIALRCEQLYRDGLSIEQVALRLGRDGITIPNFKPHEYNRWGHDYGYNRVRLILNALIELRSVADSIGVHETDARAVLRWMNEYATCYWSGRPNYDKSILRKPRVPAARLPEPGPGE